MAKLLENKVAVVTGASQGLGKAIALALNVDGAKTLLVSRREKELALACNDVEKGGQDAKTFVADVCDPASAQSVVDEAKDKFGGVDILINCAGVFVWNKFLNLSHEDWDKTISTNLSAPFYLSQAFGRALVDQKRGGSILNITSIHGQVGDPNVVPHCASKSGLIGLTRAAAEAMREYDVRVNAISPGQIENDSAERRGESPNMKVTQADIATLAVYLSSDLSKTVTGTVVDMYGSTHTTIKA